MDKRDDSDRDPGKDEDEERVLDDGDPTPDPEPSEHEDGAEATTSGPAPAKDAPTKPKRSAMGSMLGILGFVAALGGGFFVGQWLKRDDSFAEINEGERVKVRLRGDEPQLGPDDALVTIVEFADYQCPYCAKAAEPLQAVLEEYEGDVRLIYKHFPLRMHSGAEPGARAAWAAHQQGKFWPVHHLMFESRASLHQLDEKAAELGLDLDRLHTDMASPEASQAVDDDFKAGTMAGARGTPYFVVNGHHYKGSLGFPQWKQIIESELKTAKEIESQVGRAGVYAKLMENAKDRVTPPPAAGREGDPDPNVVHEVPLGDRPAMGPEDALVTMVVFSDFQCPFCARLSPTVHELAEQHGVRVVFRQLPLSMHKNARAAAKAALAAHRQGKFWEMHDALFAQQKQIPALASGSFATLAEQLGLDVERFAADLVDPAVDAMIAEDIELARKLGVKGTPASFVNGRFVSGAGDLDRYTSLADETRPAAQALVDAGTPATAVYDALMRGAAKPTTTKPAG